MFVLKLSLCVCSVKLYIKNKYVYYWINWRFIYRKTHLNAKPQTSNVLIANVYYIENKLRNYSQFTGLYNFQYQF